MFTYSHANTPLGQSDRAYYLSYFINAYASFCNGVFSSLRTLGTPWAIYSVAFAEKEWQCRNAAVC